MSLLLSLTLTLSLTASHPLFAAFDVFVLAGAGLGGKCCAENRTGFGTNLAGSASSPSDGDVSWQLQRSVAKEMLGQLMRRQVER